MAEDTYAGLPRKEIKWFPTINYELCISCGSCAQFCPHDVYDKQSDRVIVARPFNCVVGCESCKNTCPVDAISFPSRDELKQQLKKLREKYSHI